MVWTEWINYFLSVFVGFYFFSYVDKHCKKKEFTVENFLAHF